MRIPVNHRAIIGYSLLAIACILTWFLVPALQKFTETETELQKVTHSVDLLIAQAHWQLKANGDAMAANQKALPGLMAGVRDQIIKQTNGQVMAALGIVDRQITALRGDTTDEIKSALAIIDHRAVDLTGTLEGVRADFRTALKPAVETAQQVDDAAPMFLDCDHNPDCLFNRFQGTSKAIERTAQVVATEAPKMSAHAESVAGSADSIAIDITREADALTKPQTFWGGLRTWLLTLARLYGAI